MFITVIILILLMSQSTSDIPCLLEKKNLEHSASQDSKCLSPRGGRRSLFVFFFDVPQISYHKHGLFLKSENFRAFTIKKQIMQPSGEGLRPSFPAFIQLIGTVSL